MNTVRCCDGEAVVGQVSLTTDIPFKDKEQGAAGAQNVP